MAEGKAFVCRAISFRVCLQLGTFPLGRPVSRKAGQKY